MDLIFKVTCKSQKFYVIQEFVFHEIKLLHLIISHLTKPSLRVLLFLY